MRKFLKVAVVFALLWTGFHLSTTAWDLKHGSLSYKDNVDYLVK